MSFGPQFTTTPRPIHSVWVAIIAKPRLKTPEEMANSPADESSASSEDKSEDQPASADTPPSDEAFPILG